MKQITSVKQSILNVCMSLWATLTMVHANAALPTAVDPSTGAANGNFVAWLQGWFGDAAETIALVASTAGFLLAGWIVIAKFNSVRQDPQPKWGEFGVVFIVTGVVMVASGYLFTEATGVI